MAGIALGILGLVVVIVGAGWEIAAQLKRIADTLETKR